MAEFLRDLTAHQYINTQPHFIQCHPLLHSHCSMKLSFALVLCIYLPVVLLALPAQECPPGFGTSGWVNDMGFLADAVSMGGPDFKDDSQGVCGTYKVIKTCEAQVKEEKRESGGGGTKRTRDRLRFSSSPLHSSLCPPHNSTRHGCVFTNLRQIATWSSFHFVRLNRILR